MAGPSLIDQFHRQLHGRLVEEINNKIINLAAGSAKNYEEYREQIGFIRGLQQVMDLCVEVEQKLYDIKPMVEENE